MHRDMPSPSRTDWVAGVIPKLRTPWNSQHLHRTWKTWKRMKAWKKQIKKSWFFRNFLKKWLRQLKKWHFKTFQTSSVSLRNVGQDLAPRYAGKPSKSTTGRQIVCSAAFAKRDGFIPKGLWEVDQDEKNLSKLAREAWKAMRMNGLIWRKPQTMWIYHVFFENPIDEDTSAERKSEGLMECLKKNENRGTSDV